MRKTFPTHLLSDFSSTPDEANGKPSRRKRAVKARLSGPASPSASLPNPTVFDRLAQSLQPALDDVDTAWG